MPNIEGAIVRLLRTGVTISTGDLKLEEQVADGNFGTKLREAIRIPKLIADLIDLQLPVTISWDEKLISVVYQIGGFYIPLILTKKQDQPLVHGLVDFPEDYGEVMRNSVCSHEEIAALAGAIFMKIHNGRGERVLSTSPWMPYLVRYFPLVTKSTEKENEYILFTGEKD